MDHYWGIDFGGSKIEGIVIEKNNYHNIIARERIKTDSHLGYKHLLKNVKSLVLKLTKETGLEPSEVGIGIPGTLDFQKQVIKNSNTIILNGMPFKKDLELALEIPVRMANDANCFALAETRLGSVSETNPDATVVFGIIMGTGVGGGLVINKQIWEGPQGIGGEWGHSFLDGSGGKCYCGKSGCVETLISGPALEKYYLSKAGLSKSLKEIIILHENGNDEFASETYNRLIKFFGKGMANVINILDPDVIVIGGGLSNIKQIYTEGVESIKQNIFNDDLTTKILSPKLGDSAGVFGAALLLE